MNTRILTVGYIPELNHHGIPYIRLQGKWLAKSGGFNPGDKIQVQVETGRLVITPLQEENKA